ncbi:hypothetical protein P8C59_006530 [Phyllachora maydis]|uniref:Uncharacterized protein n=1 Tax=Phyllachora maydis TaxID=1825666 RepID=A0AAD9I6P0_9PEZI|nr:hypothetical protein P8C59_006530 [Phyllachora maydis]
MYIMLLTRYLNSTKDYSICFSCNGNTVADLGPKLSNSSNTTTKLSRDFHSKEGPRPLTTTSTTIVDSRNSKGSSRTSIINSSLVPIGFSDSDFAGDKATSKSTYGYLYKLAERYRAIGAKREAIIPLEKRSKSLKFTSRTEECKLLAVLGSKTYLVYIPSRRAVLKTYTVKFIEDNTVLSQPPNNTALEGELVDLDLDLEGAVSPDPSNLNTEKPISIEIGPSKLEPYESSSDINSTGYFTALWNHLIPLYSLKRLIRS